MRVNVIRKLAGDELTVTWVCSGMQPDPIHSRLYDKSQTIVSSFAGVSSGPGFYSAIHQLPAQPAQFMQEWRAWINSYEYVERQLVTTLPEEID